MAQQTRTWAEVVGLTQARAGAAFSSGTELTNIGFLLNSAARTIYDESRYWERFLVLEPRTAERGYIATTEDSITCMVLEPQQSTDYMYAMGTV